MSKSQYGIEEQRCEVVSDHQQPVLEYEPIEKRSTPMWRRVMFCVSCVCLSAMIVGVFPERFGPDRFWLQKPWREALILSPVAWAVVCWLVERAVARRGRIREVDPQRG